jgi:hypothetical protein
MAKGRRARPAAVSSVPASQKSLAFDALDETKGETKVAGTGGSSRRRVRREYTERELLGSHTDITSDVPVWEENVEERNRRWATVLFLAPIPVLVAAIVTVCGARGEPRACYVRVVVTRTPRGLPPHLTLESQTGVFTPRLTSHLHTHPSPPSPLPPPPDDRDEHCDQPLE